MPGLRGGLGRLGALLFRLVLLLLLWRVRVLVRGDRIFRGDRIVWPKKCDVTFVTPR
jgi:hypothetical protein